MGKYKLTKRGKNAIVGIVVLIIIIVVSWIYSANNNLDNVHKELGVSEDHYTEEESNLNVEPIEDVDNKNTDLVSDDLINEEEKEKEIDKDTSVSIIEKVDSDKLLLEKKYYLYFNADSYIINEEYRKSLEEILEIIKVNNYLVVVEGNYNGIFEHENYMFKNLSLNRALSVKEYFINNDIDLEKIEIINNEDLKPINKDNSDYELSLNRRVEIYFKKNID